MRRRGGARHRGLGFLDRNHLHGDVVDARLPGYEGFLYAVLLNAALTQEPGAGAAVMLGFGLGTAPALFVFGWASRTLGASARGWMLRAAGLGVAFLGAFNLLRHLAAPACCG